MRPTVTMRAALADSHLLGNALVGTSWANWRVLAVAAAGEELTSEEREIFRRYTGRAREPGARIEEALFLIGRRGGKDRAAAALATYFAVLVDWSFALARGEHGLVLCVGADTKQAAIQRNYIEGVFDASPMLSSYGRQPQRRQHRAVEWHQHRGSRGQLSPPARRDLRGGHRQ